jgi:hypothetical protein
MKKNARNIGLLPSVVNPRSAKAGPQAMNSRPQPARLMSLVALTLVTFVLFVIPAAAAPITLSAFENYWGGDPYHRRWVRAGN